jgi:hypothetical protein
MNSGVIAVKTGKLKLLSSYLDPEFILMKINLAGVSAD